MAEPITPAGALVYRAYRLDRKGRIVGTEILRTETEDQALAAARSMSALFTIKLWDCGRLVARFEPAPHGQHG